MHLKVLILPQSLDTCLLDEDPVLFLHLSDLPGSLMLGLGVELHPSEADDPCCPYMLGQDAVDVDKGLGTHLVVVGVIEGDSRVSLPDQEGLRQFLAGLRTHCLLSPLAKRVNEFKQG